MKPFTYTLQKIITLLFVLLINISTINSQQIYRVFFTDKKDCTFDPFAYFDKKAIERRIANNLSLYDSTDFPVNQYYLNTVAKMTDSIVSVSRWFNFAYVIANNEQITKINQLPFVKNIEPLSVSANLCSYFIDETNDILVINQELEKLLIDQTEILGGKIFDSAGYDGKGIRIAIFDGGFPEVNTNPFLKHVRDEGRIIKTWDFTKNREFVYSYSSHGLMVMSCIAGIYNGKKIGLATGAEFLLARTEINSEPFSEEINWLKAVEWADLNGADIINSSLGYTYHRYFNNQMDGKTSFVVKAANLAAKKGILVVNAAGNEGSSKWKFVGTPADGDSVMSVGGIAPDTYCHIYFSSYGPTTDNRLKPNVCAFADVAAVAQNNKIKRVQGTSFASPLVAGFAACAWQSNRNLTNMQLFQAIEKSAHLYPYFDYAHGYGIPQASYFIYNKKEIKPTFDIIKTNNDISVKIYPEYLKTCDKLSYLYFNVQNQNGKLELYKVIIPNQSEIQLLQIDDSFKNKIINIHYKYYTNSMLIK